MIDTSESRAAHGFVKLLDNGGLAQKIDQAMAVPQLRQEPIPAHEAHLATLARR